MSLASSSQQRKLFSLLLKGQPQNADGSLTPIDQAMKFLTSDWLFNSNDAQVIDHVFYGRVPYLTSEELENYPLDAEFRIQQLFNE